MSKRINERAEGVRGIAVFLLFLIDYFLTCFWIFFFQNNGFLNVPLNNRGIFVVVFIYCILLFFLMNYLESFRIGQRRILDLGFGFFSSSLGVNFIFWLVQIFVFREKASHSFLFCLLMLVLECLIGLCWIMLCHRRYEKVHFRKEAIFIYGNRENENEIQINKTIKRYFKISQMVHFERGLDQIIYMIPPDSVVFIGDVPGEIRNPILKYCMSKNIQCFSVPKIADIYLQNAEVMQLHDKLLFQYPRLEITGGKRFVKRSMDVIGSCIMLGVFGIPMLIFAAKIHGEDGGPVFFYQDRITIGGCPFQMVKFRSMRENAEADGARLASTHDDRITKIGKKLRNTHMDELPQLLNVLRGEMSLVGPRPERQDFADYYGERIPEFSDRLKVKAGLTGYAQIYGKYNTAAEDKIKYDLYYIYNHSIKLDIKILILTVRILFQKENTAGIPDGEIYAIRGEKEREDTAVMHDQERAVTACEK